MRRFVVNVIVISLAATLAWWVTSPLTRPTTIELAKVFHALVGFPAPYLLADLDDYHWFAPLFPPLVGLVLSSSWLSWRRRAMGLALGFGAFWYLVALQIAGVYSPYLTLSSERAYLTTIQVTLNSIVVPVILWLIVAGPPPMMFKEGRDDCNHAASRWAVRSILWTLAFCAILTAPFSLAVSQTTRSFSAARRDAARAIAHDQPKLAMPHIEEMLAIQGGRNAELSYLQMRLYDEMGDAASVRDVLPKALATQGRRMAYRKLREANN